MSTSAKKIAEGKTKEIFDATKDAPESGCSACSKVLIKSNDKVTAGDGEHRIEVPGKGIAATATTINAFKLLKKHGVATHFLDAHPEQKDAFYALRAEMIPLEVVTRRIATGSYLKRNPGVGDGLVFNMIEYEMFYKSDELHDPIAQFGGPWMQGPVLDLYQADKPITPGYMVSGGTHIGPIRLEQDINYDQMRIIALQVFLILEEAWKQLGVVLYDMKIEFGLVDDGLGGKRLVVADAITNDEWRIKDSGGRQLSKQVFRDIVKAGEVTPEHVGELSRLYNEVAALTAEFSDIGCPAR